MSGQTQLGRLRQIRDAGEVPWREGDGWMRELESHGWVERTGMYVRLTEEGASLLGVRR